MLVLRQSTDVEINQRCQVFSVTIDFSCACRTKHVFLGWSISSSFFFLLDRTFGGKIEPGHDSNPHCRVVGLAPSRRFVRVGSVPRVNILRERERERERERKRERERERERKRKGERERSGVSSSSMESKSSSFLVWVFYGRQTWKGWVTFNSATNAKVTRQLCKTTQDNLKVTEKMSLTECGMPLGKLTGSGSFCLGRDFVRNRFLTFGLGEIACQIIVWVREGHRGRC